MCGRYELNETPARLGSRYHIDPGDLKFAINADVRPTDTNPVILQREGQRVASMRTLGIVPFWAKDPKAISTPFNARVRGSLREADVPRPHSRIGAALCLRLHSSNGRSIPDQKKKQKIRISRADR